VDVREEKNFEIAAGLEPTSSNYGKLFFTALSPHFSMQRRQVAVIVGSTNAVTVKVGKSGCGSHQ